ALRRRDWEAALAATDEGLAAPGLEERVRRGLWANRALALVQLGQAADAVDAFARVQPWPAENLWLLYQRGLARLASGDCDGGSADLLSVAGALPRRNPLRRQIEARLDGRRVRLTETLLALQWRFSVPVVKAPGG
ncbi:MAG: hypothetical protein LC792_13230, partial [Actinobacteria bacterium]|nr:hypothetical protein [Actinomycetota bacterium]